jgi:CheY-like chemotaxis protein
VAKVLLVEDNELNRDMLSRRLLKRGFQVDLALDGLEGIAAATSGLPDLILLDMGLPGIDGSEVARRLKASLKTQKIPIIALTAHARKEDETSALAAGCNDFDTKPVDLDRLLSKMQSALIKRNRT